MSTPARLAAFALGLAAVFGAALGVGAVVGPGSATAGETTGHGAQAEAHGADAAHSEDGGAAAELPAGLQVSEAGYTLALSEDAVDGGAAVPVSFRILGPDGRPVTDYEVEHEQELHLIAVRRDLDAFQHVHPELGPDGVWTTPLDLTPGSWRLIADFVPGPDGEKHVLGADLSVRGTFEPVSLPAPSATAEVDGYTVTLTGELEPGRESDLTLTVQRDGRPVTDLQPYLGANGHLVVLRAGDLGYLHVHPTGDVGDAAGPDIGFATTAPSAGTYRLFLDFRHGDVVRTAAFTVEVPS